MSRGRNERLVRFDVHDLCHAEPTPQLALDYCLGRLKPSVPDKAPRLLAGLGRRDVVVALAGAAAGLAAAGLLRRRR